MPFLRRRGIMASESDMRRHSSQPQSLTTADASDHHHPGQLLEKSSSPKPNQDANGSEIDFHAVQVPSPRSHLNTDSNASSGTASYSASKALNDAIVNFPQEDNHNQSSQLDGPLQLQLRLPSSRLSSFSDAAGHLDFKNEIIAAPHTQDDNTIAIENTDNTDTSGYNPAASHASRANNTHEQDFSRGRTTHRASHRTNLAATTCQHPAASTRRSHDIPQSSFSPSSTAASDNTKNRRFSLRFRNASDSQLPLRLKQLDESPPPPLPAPPPGIITTAPTGDFVAMQKKPSRLRLPRFRLSKNASTNTLKKPSPSRLTTGPPSASDPSGPGPSSGSLSRKPSRALNPSANLDGNLQTPLSSSPPSADTSFDSIDPISSSPAPTLDGQAGDTMAYPTTLNRRSDSSGPSDVSSADPKPQSVNQRSSSSIFRLTRRKTRAGEPLFPTSHLPQKPKVSLGDDSHFESDTSNSLNIPNNGSLSFSPNTDRPVSRSKTYAPHTPRPRSVRSKTAAAPSLSPSPATALFRPQSNHSGRSSPIRSQTRRGRSSTLSSLGHDSNDENPAPPSSRPSFNSGRKSFGDLFGLGRLRQNSDATIGRSGNLTPITPGSVPSKNNSLQLVREEFTLPEKREDDTPVKYLARVEGHIPRGSIASALSKSSDPFYSAVLRSYMRKSSFFGDPMDMALRKLLMEAELPKETQQIDRCLVAFANRYHECNPGIYANPDQAYFVAFSLLILHTDVFNKNNKHKMQKADYLKNTREQGVYDDILDCFYDNITYTPFIHVEDDFDSNSERHHQNKGRRRPIFPGAPPEIPKKSKEPIDPYTLILDGKLDNLRPSFKDVMSLEDHYTYLGTASRLDLKELQKTFFRTGVLQIVSARSRPDAFLTEKTASNPQVAHPGIVDIKVTKVGLLWRKDAKKKKTRSPWQEWGAILTGAQLYFFRNTTWIKSLMHQFETHMKQGNDDVPVIFKPPLEQFKPDALMSTDGAVALHDMSYKKHKHAFVYVRHGGFEEVLLADDEMEMNDWLAKLNYAAAFKTSGVRMRGVVGANYDGQSRRAIRRLDSADGAQVVQTPSGEVSITRGRIDHKMAEDISAARRQVILDKVVEADERLSVAQKLLDLQLRNARHLQIMAPIQVKTREQVLLSAARMSAQLKWTRAEIWRLKCHRDILMQDMEEERLLISPPGSSKLGSVQEDAYATHEASRPTTPSNDSHPSKSPITSGSLKASTKIQTPLSLSLSPQLGVSDLNLSSNIEGEDDEATASPTAAHDNCYRSESASSPNEESSAAERTLQATSSSSTTSPQRKSDADKLEKESGDDNDIVEHNLLEQAGLLRSSTTRNWKSTTSSVQHGGIDVDPEKEKADRSKIRRSLQRTLREGGTRSKKGKEPAQVTDEEERLARGNGSFTVHGKKASVINFGSELHNLPSKRTETDLSMSPSSLDVVEDDDFHSAQGDFDDWRERRGSTASASTATARSFRELHRKYSTAHPPRAHSTPGKLAAPSDTESEVAVSFSEGQRTPLPPIENSSDIESDAKDAELHEGHAQNQAQKQEQHPSENPPQDVPEDD
ncbi:Arf guanine nucleotide exchange factor sec74 [Ceratocystis lukuohia]|uniref:Arf guanine nucleotide exchange factor sec74 n=1 Tax=Ceratocystis lukuohia TaxID=2019550 RepID=A0ABR4MIQ2_9PEZI